MRRMDEMEPCSAEDSRDGTDGQMNEKDHRRVGEREGWTRRPEWPRRMDEKDGR